MKILSREEKSTGMRERREEEEGKEGKPMDRGGEVDASPRRKDAIKLEGEKIPREKKRGCNQKRTEQNWII
jgi:hypothetical protein